MKIDKIKNYNQIVLAIMSTLGCLLLLVIIIVLVIDSIPNRYYDDKPQGLIANDQIETLNQENLRKQIISYETPWLIDTLRSTYIIPVSIKTLKKPEISSVSYEEDYSSLMSSASRMRKGYYQHKHFDGKYTNLIIYQPNQEKTKSLFNERVIIGNVNTYYFKDDILLIFFLASEDTDKNGVIDMDDLRTCCVYSLKDDRMRTIRDGENQITGYKFIENSKDMILEYDLSEYKKNMFDDNSIPGKLMKYTYITEELENIIPREIQELMQKLVEGKK